MQIIKGKTNIDFIGKRRIAILLSTAVNIAIVVGIAVLGFKLRRRLRGRYVGGDQVPLRY